MRKGASNADLPCQAPQGLGQGRTLCFSLLVKHYCNVQHLHIGPSAKFMDSCQH